MLYLITGGSGSGKSEYAEKKICELCEKAESGKKIYVATMIPCGEETKRKILRHRKMRAEKAFITEECYTDLEGFAEERIQKTELPLFVLLECMSNLTANELFEPEGAGEHTPQKVIRGIEKLIDSCRDVVVVTNEVCSESAEDTPEMQKYKQVLSEVNRWMAQRAAEVTEVVYGIPLVLKAAENRSDQHVENQAVSQCGRAREISRNNGERSAEKRRTGMKLIIGGAFQGKMEYAERRYPGIQWIDGAECEPEEIFSCGGVYHFEEYVKRFLQNVQKEEQTQRERQPLSENWREWIDGLPVELVIVGNEIGYGLVPVDAFERSYREQYGRICTMLAERAERVDRVVCGIGMKIKG